jgi:hypothetical protein
VVQGVIATDMFSDGKVDARGVGGPQVNSARGRQEWDLSYGSLVTAVRNAGPELRHSDPSYFVEQVSLTIFRFTT